ncbi:MAG: SUKH-4 family immunity protein [Pseudomonadota bacterium]
MGEDFEQRWAKKEAELGLYSEMVVIDGVVLPKEAAPCLSFEARENRKVYEVFGIPEQWSKSERARLDEFFIIGIDGCGNPICVREGDGVIVMLDHEDKFQTEQFVNTGINHLAECLLAYLGETSESQFKMRVRKIDRDAMNNGSFWQLEATAIEYT